ncbi:MAG: CinA family nicotinamide mononucleotide deamidase-related protein [Sporichthyaceae bacterium]
MTRVELITVGDELLSGLVLNSNVGRVADALGAIGLRLSVVTDVRDDIGEIVAALNAAASRAQIVLCSGGLGPTGDDLTRDAIAAAAGVALHRHADIEETIRERYAGWKLTAPDLAMRQADVPEGAEAIPNPRGSAPGLRMPLREAVVWALPGVPGELVAMLDEHVVPRLAHEVGTSSLTTTTVRVALLGESAIAAELVDLEKAGEVSFAYLASPGDVLVRLTGEPDATARAAAAVWDRLGPAAYSSDGATLPMLVHRLLAEAGGSLAVAESLTGGMLAAALTDPAGASATFRGGSIVYATAAKVALGVDPGLLAERGPVDPDVALALAQCVRERYGATHGVATTGVAGPDLVGEIEVGTVYVAVADAAGTRVVRLALPPRREFVRQLSVVHALDLVRRRLLGLDPSSSWTQGS